jgi:hypothetical protein
MAQAEESAEEQEAAEPGWRGFEEGVKLAVFNDEGAGSGWVTRGTASACRVVWVRSTYLRNLTRAAL